MQDLKAYANHYLEKLKGSSSDWEDAYHRLIEADHAILPILNAAFREESEPALRATLVEIIWQHRLPGTVDFLAEALEDSNPEVWKNSLDGLVRLGNREAIQVLESAKCQVKNRQSDRIRWIDEAIQQIMKK